MIHIIHVLRRAGNETNQEVAYRIADSAIFSRRIIFADFAD